MGFWTELEDERLIEELQNQVEKLESENQELKDELEKQKLIGQNRGEEGVKPLSQVLEELKSDVGRAEYVDSEYVDSVSIENLRAAIKCLEEKFNRKGL